MWYLRQYTCLHYLMIQTNLRHDLSSAIFLQPCSVGLHSIACCDIPSFSFYLTSRSRLFYSYDFFGDLNRQHYINSYLKTVIIFEVIVINIVIIKLNIFCFRAFFFSKFFKMLIVVFLGLTSTTLLTLLIIKCVVMQKFENRFNFQ